MTKREFSSRAAEMCGLTLAHGMHQPIGDGACVMVIQRQAQDDVRMNIPFDPWTRDPDAIRLWDAVCDDESCDVATLDFQVDRKTRWNAHLWNVATDYYGSGASTRTEAICRCVAAWKGWVVE